MKNKFYDVHFECTDENGEKHTVTVVGKVSQFYERKHVEKDVTVPVNEKSVVNGKLTYKQKIMTRCLTIGASICHPEDEYDNAIGVDIAKRRIKEGYILGSISTHDPSMLTSDQVNALLLVKLAYICEHIDEFIS